MNYAKKTVEITVIQAADDQKQGSAQKQKAGGENGLGGHEMLLSFSFGVLILCKCVGPAIPGPKITPQAEQQRNHPQQDKNQAEQRDEVAQPAERSRPIGQEDPAQEQKAGGKDGLDGHEGAPFFLIQRQKGRTAFRKTGAPRRSAWSTTMLPVVHSTSVSYTACLIFVWRRITGSPGCGPPGPPPSAGPGRRGRRPEAAASTRTAP